MAYERNLNPRRRSVFGRAGLTYFRQTVGRDLGPSHNPDAGLHVAGTAFRADEIGLTLRTTTGAPQPKLGLGVELSRCLEPVADAGYLLFLRTRTQLALDERSSFWLSRSAAVLDLPAAEAMLRVNGQSASAAPWQPGRLTFGFGLLYRSRWAPAVPPRPTGSGRPGPSAVWKPYEARLGILPAARRAANCP